MKKFLSVSLSSLYQNMAKDTVIFFQIYSLGRIAVFICRTTSFNQLKVENIEKLIMFIIFLTISILKNL